MPKTETETIVGKLAIGLADTSQDAPVSVITLKQINFCLPGDTTLSEDQARSILFNLSVHKLEPGRGVCFRQCGVVWSVEMERRSKAIYLTVFFRREFASAVKSFKPFCT